MRAAFLALLASTSIAFAKPVPEKFDLATLPDVTRVQDKLGGRAGVIDRDKLGGDTVVANPKGIFVGGKNILTLTNGAVDPSEKEGGALGNSIPRLTAAVPVALAPDQKTAAPVVLGLDRSLPYKLLFEMIYSLRKGRTSFQVLVMAGGSVQAVPIDLPTAPIKDDLKMVVAASKTQVLVFSLSGKEGTLKKPLLSIQLDDKKGEIGRSDAAMQVRATLEKVATKWSAKKKVTFGKTIILMADGGTSMQFVAELMVAARIHFPNLALSPGHE